MTERIVIADNNPNLVKYFSETLKKQNYLPIVSNRAQELIEYIKTNPSPELILIDNSFTHNGGEKLIADLHKNHKDTFIIYLIDRNDNSRIKDLIKEETDDFFPCVKPEGAEEKGSQYPFFSVDFRINKLFFLIYLELEPRTPVGNDSGRIHPLFVGENDAG